MSILRFLGLSSDRDTEAQQNQDVESIRKISQQLAEMEPQRARYVAAFAYLLGRVAHADRDISRDEEEEMERIVMEQGHLPKEQAVMIVEIAKRQNQLFGHVENFLVTREFNQLTSREMKMDLLNCLFAVSSSDESVSTAEDSEIRQITSELLLDHSDFIETRSKYRGFLDVLKDSKD